MKGWSGKVLRVDLERRRLEAHDLGRDAAKDYLGGRGLNSRVLFDEIRPGIDPLAPENVLCLAAGPLSGTALKLSSRCHISTLSPYSGILGDGSAGGAFAALLKRAGYDQIVVTGAAEQPTYLWVEDGQSTLLDASDLWGRSAWEATDLLERRHGTDVSVACIGRAGENLVRFASTIVDKYSSGARGSGAVWGSKRLKAIVVRGTRPVPLADRDRFEKLADEDARFFQEDRMQRLVVGVYGTHIGMLGWEPGYRHYARRLRDEEVPASLRPMGWKKFEIGRDRCHSCSVACRNLYQIPSGPDGGEVGAALQFEGISALGTNCGIFDPVAIMRMANLSDKEGMCQMGLGDTLSLVRHLFHEGVLTTGDTDGLRLDWEADPEMQVELIRRTIRRSGFGSLVAEGGYGFAKRIGRGAIDYCYHVKGLSHGHHPAGLFGLAHATSTRGADHLRGRSWAFRGRGAEQLAMEKASGQFPDDVPLDPVEGLTLGEKASTLADSTGRCKGAVNSWVCAVPLVWKYPLFDGVARLMSAATGVDFDEGALEQATERVYLLEMAFNARQGVTRKDDRLPQPPEIRDTADGAAQRQEHEALLTRYYLAHGCDPATGWPTRPRLDQVGLRDVADTLERDQPYRPWDGPPLWPLERYPHSE